MPAIELAPSDPSVSTADTPLSATIDESIQPSPTPTETIEPEPAEPQPHPNLRTSTADGKFSVEAEFLSLTGDTVKLRRKDNGAEIKVPRSLLSSGDQEWIKRRR